MKVLIVNGSAHQNGATARGLYYVEQALLEEGIEVENFFIPNDPISDCRDCLYCKKAGKCVIDDIVNEAAEKARECDGFVFGSPVYYSHPTGKLLSFMDRLFYSSASALAGKPGAAVVCARRAGNTSSFDVINKYFTIYSMPVVSSTYWNNIFGKSAEDVDKDKEGVATMRNLGKNMAWLLKSIAAGGEPRPEYVRERTNFHR